MGAVPRPRRTSGRSARWGPVATSRWQAFGRPCQRHIDEPGAFVRAGVGSADWTADWVYVLGPLAGVAIAVACARILRGRGRGPISHATGSGVLTPGGGRRARTSRWRSTRVGRPSRHPRPADQPLIVRPLGHLRSGRPCSLRLWAGRGVSARRVKRLGVFVPPDTSMAVAWPDGSLSEETMRRWAANGSRRLILRFSAFGDGAVLEV